MKNKVVFIICYFGTCPNYYSLWENSAIFNKNFNFLIFTDNDGFKDNKNIKVIKTSLKEISKLATEKIGVNIDIKKPYKLCDFKPTYGLIFEDYIKEYDFWGYCDMDLVFGKLDDFLNDSIFEKNDVILNLGHMTLYKNNEKNKYLFKKNGSIYGYDLVLTSEENYAFDEMSGMHLIFKKENIKPFLDIPIADIDRRVKKYNLDGNKNYKKQFFYYKNGEIKRKYISKNKIYEDKFIYLHFQKRKPQIFLDNLDYFMFTEKGFEKYDEQKGFKENTNIYFLNVINKFMYFFKQIGTFIMLDSPKKKIWLKQKINKGS